MRRSSAEVAEQKLRRLSTAYIPLGGLLIAILTLGVSNYIQFSNSASQNRANLYEASLPSKLDSFSSFIDAMYRGLSSATKQNAQALERDETEMERTFFKLESFLKQEERESAWQDVQNFQRFLNRIYDMPEAADRTLADVAQEFTSWRTKIRDTLIKDLFANPY